MNAKPYVGITGFKTPEEVTKVAEQYSTAGLNECSAYMPMFGYLVSEKRLADKTSVGTQSPAANDLAGLARLAPFFSLPAMHYHTTRKERIAQEVDELFSLNNLYDCCHALQLNVDWPEPRQLENILATFPDMHIILQLPKRATTSQSPEETARRAKEYENLAAYLLIDPSGGLGIDFDSVECVALMHALEKTMPHTTQGIAGGLSGDNVTERIATIKHHYYLPFCIDAQGKLRTPDKEALDFERTKKYINEAAKALRKATGNQTREE